MDICQHRQTWSIIIDKLLHKCNLSSVIVVWTCPEEQCWDWKWPNKNKVDRCSEDLLAVATNDANRFEEKPKQTARNNALVSHSAVVKMSLRLFFFGCHPKGRLLNGVVIDCRVFCSSRQPPWGKKDGLQHSKIWKKAFRSRPGWGTSNLTKHHVKTSVAARTERAAWKCWPRLGIVGWRIKLWGDPQMSLNSYGCWVSYPKSLGVVLSVGLCHSVQSQTWLASRREKKKRKLDINTLGCDWVQTGSWY